MARRYPAGRLLDEVLDRGLIALDHRGGLPAVKNVRFDRDRGETVPPPDRGLLHLVLERGDRRERNGLAGFVEQLQVLQRFDGAAVFLIGARTVTLTR